MKKDETVATDNAVKQDSGNNKFSLYYASRSDTFDQAIA